MSELEKSAKKARPEQYKELEAAHKKLKKSVEDVPKDQTLGQTQANIQAGKADVRAAYNRLAQSISCS
jgi:predicted Zn-dependent protease